jgi:putative flippase GtrA
MFGSMTFLFRQFSSFVVVGFIATGVHYMLLIGLVELAGISAVAAALVGFLAGGTVSYGLNRRHVFRTELPHAAAVSRFTLVAGVGFGLTYIFMSLFVRAAGIPYLPAQVATTGIVMLWNFAAHRMWTFPVYRDAKGLAASAERTSRPPREGR